MPRPKSVEKRARLAIAYLRADDDCGIREQRRRIQGLALLSGFEIVAERADSGPDAVTTDGPGWKSAMEQVRARQVGVLLISKVDRCASSFQQLAKIIETCDRYKTILVFCHEGLDTSSAGGKFGNYIQKCQSAIDSTTHLWHSGM